VRADCIIEMPGMDMRRSIPNNIGQFFPLFLRGVFF